MNDILNQTIEDVSSILWTEASAHMDGVGLEEGPDLTALWKHLKSMRRKDRHQAVTLLQTIAAGGAWSLRRKY